MRNVPWDCVQIDYWILPERTHLTIEGISAKERMINGLMWQPNGQTDSRDRWITGQKVPSFRLSWVLAVYMRHPRGRMTRHEEKSLGARIALNLHGKPFGNGHLAPAMNECQVQPGYDRGQGQEEQRAFVDPKARVERLEPRA